VFNHVCEEEIDHSWVPASAQLRLRFREEASLAREYADLLDEVPVMSATVLGLDMILQEPYVDLRSVSDLILSDVGATIQILRLIRREYDFAADRPSRIGECLASLDVKTWYRAVSARTFACDRKNAAIAALWKHCREIAQYAQLVAESMEDIVPEDAYLVGLLHGIAAIPPVLGWPISETTGRAESALLAMEETLPVFVLDALRGLNDSSPTSGWRFILTAAHDLAASGRDVQPIQPTP